MEIQQLRHLLAAANSISYAQAAKKCFTSRQNIAHSVKALESELGVVLFERKGNGMMLTNEGRQVAQAVCDILSKIDDLRVLFAGYGHSGFALSLAVSTNLFAGMPDEADRLLLQRLEGLQFFELDCERCYELVCEGRVDAALVMCMDRSFPKCDAVRIGGSVAYALVDESSSLAKLSGCVAGDLAARKLVLMSEPVFQYEPLFVQLDQLGFDRSNVSVLPSTSSMIHLVRMQGEEYVGIPSHKFASRPPFGTVAVPIVDPRMNWGFYLLRRSGERTGDAVDRLMHDIRKAFKESFASSAL